MMPSDRPRSVPPDSTLLGDAARREGPAIEWPGGDDGGIADVAKELLSSDYYLRQWGRIGMRNRSEEVDEFGLDPKYEARVRPVFDFLYERYFRVETSGIEAVPSEGRCVLVANHSGVVPYDGIMLRVAMRRDHPSQRDLRWLTEDFITYLPFVGAFMNRIGAVRACQENAERLLRKGSLVAVFPEGVKGIGKLFKDRYRLQRFGRGGFIRLCLRTATPIVPCAIVGAEETSPMLYRFDALARTLGLPYIPVTPTFPALGPLGLVPAPTKWRIIFGERIDLDDHGPEAANDAVLVARLAERVRATIQEILDRALSERKSVFFGLRHVHGIVLVDKPRGPSSHDVVAFVRRALRTRKVGHAGTLDPMATGLLVVLVGDATRLEPVMSSARKSYVATIAFGVETDSLDGDGTVTRRVELTAAIVADAEKRLPNAIRAERGRTTQIPPAISAIHVGGARAYELARRGKGVVLAARDVLVHALDIVRVDAADESFELTVSLDVSKGYYVRSLARDLGAALGLPAHVTALRRTKSGPFDVRDAAPLDEAAIASALRSIEDVAPLVLPIAQLTEEGASRAMRGQALSRHDFEGSAPEGVSLFARGERIVAIGDGLRVRRGFPPR